MLSAGYTYMTEFWPEKQQSIAGTMFMFLGGITIIALVIHFHFITVHWEGIIYYAAA